VPFVVSYSTSKMLAAAVGLLYFSSLLDDYRPAKYSIWWQVVTIKAS